MKTLTLDQLAQSEFVLSQNTSLQVTGGEDNPLARRLFRWGAEFFVGLAVEEGIRNMGYIATVDVFRDKPMDCEILTGYCAK